MFKLVATILFIATSMAAHASTDAPVVKLETSHGDITLQLDAKAAPKTVENFVKYVEDGFYDDTIFHRVIRDFMIQGGGFDAQMKKKQTRAPVKNEADNGLKNVRGSVAMARTQDPHSATAQFFINTVDNAFLDFSAPNLRGWGYAVFGKVIEGMETVDKIRAVTTGTKGGFRDVPVETVTINKVLLIKKETQTAEEK